MRAVARRKLGDLCGPNDLPALADLLDRSTTTEDLEAAEQALAARIGVSLATVYNTLNQFKAAGLLREVAFEGDRTFFDTNTSNHFHYYIEETDSLVDIGTEDLEVLGLPPLPPGTEIDRVDIIIRLRKRAG